MKRIFFLILLAVMSTGIYAQTDDKGYKEGAWVLNGVTGLNLSPTVIIPYIFTIFILFEFVYK